jgi:hypothetical protein
MKQIIGISLNIGFRRTLFVWIAWLHLPERLIMVNLTKETHVFVWKLT